MAVLSSKVELVQFHRFCAGMAGDMAMVMARGRLEGGVRDGAEVFVLGRGRQRQRRRVPGYKQTRHISKHIPRGGQRPMAARGLPGSPESQMGMLAFDDDRLRLIAGASTAQRGPEMVRRCHAGDNWLAGDRDGPFGDLFTKRGTVRAAFKIFT